MPTIKSILLTAICVLILPLVSQADTNTDTTASHKTDHKRLITQLTALGGFTAGFSQQVYNDTHDLIENSVGTMAFRRPGQFRWIYKEPYEQSIISNGSTLWVYDKDLEQVSIRPVEQGMNQTPIRLLDDPASITKDFNIESLSNKEFETIVRLLPKGEDAGFKSVVLTFFNGELSVMRIHDNFDQTSLLTFNEINTSPDFKGGDFQFEPPEGVDVIDATKQPD